MAASISFQKLVGNDCIRQASARISRAHETCASAFINFILLRRLLVQVLVSQYGHPGADFVAVVDQSVTSMGECLGEAFPQPLVEPY